MSTDRFHTLAAAGNRVTVDTEIGHLRALELSHGGRSISPLHVAPWTSDAPIDRLAALAPTEQALAGDFLCAPFCANDIEGGPIHGWTANAPWRLTSESSGAALAEATFTLSRPVMGAEVTKRLRFRAGEPFLYIAHTFTGGSGRLPIGHHAMIRVADTAAISYSPKALVFTGDDAPETDPARGRSLLKYPTRSDDLHAVALAAGGTADLGSYPFAEGHEDVVSLLEGDGSSLGWTAAVREAEDDIVLLLRNARLLPMTSLWMSNGGRYYAPWNSRHTRVLGLEDGRSFGTAGHRASIGDNELTRRGVPTAFDLGAALTIPYVIGAIPRPAGWQRVANVQADGGSLVISEIGGGTVTIPFDGNWLDATATA